MFENRIPQARSSAFYANNEALLQHISVKKGELELLSYCVVLLGDFNGRIAHLPNFNFRSYPHRVNNNGELRGSFALQHKLFFMNPPPWDSHREELFSVQVPEGFLCPF